MTEVSFDYENLTEVEGGLRRDELGKVRPRLREATDGFLEDPPGFMRLPKTGEYAEACARVAEEIRSSGAMDFIHVGTRRSTTPTTTRSPPKLAADRGSTSPRTRIPTPSRPYSTSPTPRARG
jgi:hypothetical protein